MTELMWQQSFLRFGICVLLAGVLWFIPISEDLPVKGWHVFSVFIAVIVSFILRPYPIGAMVIFGLVALMATGIITTQEALAGYGDPMVWLIVAAFLLAGRYYPYGIGAAIGAFVGQPLGEISLGIGILDLRCRVVAGASGAFKHRAWWRYFSTHRALLGRSVGLPSDSASRTSGDLSCAGWLARQSDHRGDVPHGHGGQSNGGAGCQSGVWRHL